MIKPKEGEGTERVHPAQLTAVILLIASAPLMSIFAGPLTEYAMAAATQLHNFNSNINAVLTGAR